MRQIIAIGGGGFSGAPGSLDQYILNQSNATVPKVCFVPTANGDADAGVVRFYDVYNKLNCKPVHLPFFRRTPDIRSLILSQDIVFVGGGNTKSMLAVWREWGLPDILNEALDQGVVFAGGSAGAICWFEQGVTDSWADALYVMDCLGFLKGSCCPHYDSEPARRPSYCEQVRTGQAMPGLALCDHAAGHFKDGVLDKVVVARETAKAFQVSCEAGNLQEDELQTERL